MRDKQIEEMAEFLYNNRPWPELWEEDAQDIAKVLCNAGYRKKSDVALEVIREVIGIFMISDTMKHIDTLSKKERWSFDKEKYKKGIAELKKKYESEGEG